MSHTMNIDTEIHDQDALAATCERLGYRLGQEDFRGRKLTCIYQPGRSYGPMVVNIDGSVTVDTDYWSKDQINELKAYYGLEKAKVEARREGHSTYESWNEETQEMELYIQVGGVE